MSHASDIENIIEKYWAPAPPAYSDRELSRQLAVAQTALGRVEIQRNKLERQNDELHKLLEKAKAQIVWLHSLVEDELTTEQAIQLDPVLAEKVAA